MANPPTATPATPATLARSALLRFCALYGIELFLIVLIFGNFRNLWFAKRVDECQYGDLDVTVEFHSLFICVILDVEGLESDGCDLYSAYELEGSDLAQTARASYTAIMFFLVLNALLLLTLLFLYGVHPFYIREMDEGAQNVFVQTTTGMKVSAGLNVAYLISCFIILCVATQNGALRGKNDLLETFDSSVECPNRPDGVYFGYGVFAHVFKMIRAILFLVRIWITWRRTTPDEGFIELRQSDELAQAHVEENYTRMPVPAEEDV